jgi:integrase
LVAGVIRVERAWDQYAGPIEPKSRTGRRAVPISSTLRALLVEHRIASRPGDGLVFGRADGSPFCKRGIAARADRVWKAAGLARITPHEARHTYASLMIAAGVNAKTLSTCMGHATVAITLDRYGHLLPGAEHEAAAMLDALLATAQSA